MRNSVLTVLVVVAACQQQRSAPAAAAPEPAKPTSAPSPSTPPLAWTQAQEACVDRTLTARGLDAYGSPQGTNYAGGTPLFDEATGKSTSRQAFLARRMPDILKACDVGP